jgi:hypothetical protein
LAEVNSLLESGDWRTRSKGLDSLVEFVEQHSDAAASKALPIFSVGLQL